MPLLLTMSFWQCWDTCLHCVAAPDKKVFIRAVEKMLSRMQYFGVSDTLPMLSCIV